MAFSKGSFAKSPCGDPFVTFHRLSWPSPKAASLDFAGRIAVGLDATRSPLGRGYTMCRMKVTPCVGFCVTCFRAS